jgi:multidrug efflux pump
VNYFSYDDRSYRVIPQVERRFRLLPEQLRDYHVATQAGALVPLSAVATLGQSVEPRALLRFNQLNAATLSGVPAPGVSLGEAVEYLRREAGVLLPASYVTDWAGESRQYVTESGALLLAFVLALVLMYLTLSAQYSSFRDPAIMLVSVPMSLAGALAFFALGVVSVNIYTQIGLLALIGSIIRHGILLVEFANDLQGEEGLGRRAAMEKAAALRLRSILMTTLATLLGLVPLLLAASGPGAASRFAISFTLGVGMAIGTLFTLFVVPALYTVVATERAGTARTP